MLGYCGRRRSLACSVQFPSSSNASFPPNWRSVMRVVDRPVVSDKKCAANRRNAGKSTGPRTDAGKLVSSRNAVTHGLFCRDLVLPGEDDAELLRFHAAMLADLRPRG